jgi:5S rRNA maturation endonuclease (ribonuclease M5)
MNATNLTLQQYSIDVSKHLSQFIEKLKLITGHTPSGPDSTGWYSAICPAHEDKNPSLRFILNDNGRIGLHCNVGCKEESILDRLGLEEKDLWPEHTRYETNKKPTKTIDTIYDYTDENNKLLYQIVRYKPKQFRVRRPNHDQPGDYIWKLDETRRVLYNLPGILKGIEEGNPIIIVEGEKDVDTLTKLGFLATTNVFGATKGQGKWTEDYSKSLHNANVIIIPDNDEAGMAHANNIIESLRLYAVSIKTNLLPENIKDITQWVESGATKSWIEELIKHAFPFEDFYTEDNNTENTKEPTLIENNNNIDKIFWYIDDKKFKIDQLSLIEVMNDQGFYKLYPYESLKSILLYKKANIVKEVSNEIIKDHIHQWIENKTIETDENEDNTKILIKNALIKGTNVYFGRPFLEHLPQIADNFNYDTLNCAYFYFLNGFVKVTKEDTVFHEYNELHGYIWNQQIISRNYNPTDPKSSEFNTFLANVTKKDATRLFALKTAIGYLLHRYKDPSNAKVVTFLDEAISDNPQGRTGKSLIAKAIGQVRNITTIDGRKFKSDSSFPLQRVNLNTELVSFDDVKNKFPFEWLFHSITDGLEVEHKNKPMFKFPPERSPKFIISTNYTIKVDGDSGKDRIIEYELYNHYTKDHKPIHEFGHLFFLDWNEDEWNKFYSLMIECVMLYLEHGLIFSETENLSRKKLINETCTEFAEYATTYFCVDNPNNSLDEYWSKKEIFNQFKALYPDCEHLSTTNKLSLCFKRYAEIYNLEYHENRIHRNLPDNNRTTEMCFKIKPKSK